MRRLSRLAAPGAILLRTPQAPDAKIADRDVERTLVLAVHVVSPGRIVIAVSRCNGISIARDNMVCWPRRNLHACRSVARKSQIQIKPPLARDPSAAIQVVARRRSEPRRGHRPGDPRDRASG